MPIGIPGAIIGSAIVGGLVSSKASKSAANTQAAAADRAAELQKQQYDQTRADQAPWRAAGETALSSLVSGLAPGGQFTNTFGMDDYQADPGYQFRLQEGQKGIDAAAGARGSRYSGATLKALTRFNSNQASQEYGAAYNRFNNDQNTLFNRYSGVAGTGQAATNQVQSAGQNYAGQAGQAFQDAGTARASGYVGAGNAVNGALGQVGNYYSLQSLLPQMNATGAAARGSVENVLY